MEPAGIYALRAITTLTGLELGVDEGDPHGLDQVLFTAAMSLTGLVRLRVCEVP